MCERTSRFSNTIDKEKERGESEGSEETQNEKPSIWSEVQNEAETRKGQQNEKGTKSKEGKFLEKRRCKNEHHLLGLTMRQECSIYTFFCLSLLLTCLLLFG